MTGPPSTRLLGYVLADKLHTCIEISYKTFQTAYLYRIPFLSENTMPTTLLFVRANTTADRRQVACFVYIIFIAEPILPFDSWCMNSGILFSIGQPFTHWGTLQRRHLLASVISLKSVKWLLRQRQLSLPSVQTLPPLRRLLLLIDI